MRYVVANKNMALLQAVTDQNVEQGKIKDNVSDENLLEAFAALQAFDGRVIIKKVSSSSEVR